MSKFYLLLDLDDTLFDAESAYAFSLKSIGIDPQSTDYCEARQTIKSRLGEGHVGARNRILYFKQMLDRKTEYSHHRVLDLMDQYEKNLNDNIKNQWSLLGRRKLFEGKLKEIPKVIVTNENLRTQMIKLRAIDPDGNLFPHVMTSEEMGVEKPSLILFEQAAKLLGAKISECVMVGDSLETDMAPAIQLGMRAFLTTEFRKPNNVQELPKEVRVLNRLDELERVF